LSFGHFLVIKSQAPNRFLGFLGVNVMKESFGHFKSFHTTIERSRRVIAKYAVFNGYSSFILMKNAKNNFLQIFH
jgi:hypothetical protein